MIYSIYFSNYLVDLIYNIKNVLISSSNMLWSENNNTLIKAFSNAVGSAGIYEVFTAIIWALMAIIVIIVFVSMNLKIFKVYLERVIVVGVLIMIFPIVTVFYAFEKSGIKKGATFESWLRTYMDQVFIQPVHAISLVLIMVALNAIAETVIVQIPIIGMIVVLMVLNMMFSIENVIKRVFAINGAALGQPVNPTAPAAAALGIAAPMARHGFNSGQKTFSELKAAKTKGAFGKALKSGMKSGLHFGVIGKNRIRNLEALLGGAGVSLPKGILGREHMSVKEQKDAERLMLKASRNKNLKSIAGNQLWESVKNLKNTTDPDIVAEAFRKLPGFSEMKLRNALLRGEGSADDLLNARKFMAMMADPTVDVSGLDKDEFNYYSNKDDSEINRDLAKGKKITRGTRVSDDVKLARKTYMLRNPDKGDKYMGAVGLDNAKIEAIESGSSTYTDSNGKVQSISANDTLAYELMIRKFGGSDIAIDDCKDTSGYFDSNIVHNIDMSDSEIKHDLKNGKKTTLGRSVDNSTVTARKLYEINNPKVAEKIRIELGLDVEQINAIEAGQSTYTAGGVTHSITADDVLSYKVMMDRYRSGKDMEDYMDSNGDISEIIYEGISMSDRALNTEALDLTQKMPDVINNSADKERARTVLAGLRNRDENELFKAVRSVGKNVNFNDINDFIDGKKVSCDSAAILAVIDEVIKNR